MPYAVIITDRAPPCPGTITRGPWPTRREAQWWLDNELAAARELFGEGCAHISGKVVRLVPGQSRAAGTAAETA